MPYRDISEYGVIGDMHSAALVSRDGSIDWLCFPRFDSPSVFGALLDDAKGGYFRVRPVGDFQSEHSYLPDSNVLVASFRTESGVATLTDFMPVREELTQCGHEVARIARCQSGSVEMEVEFQPRLDYGRAPTKVTVDGRSAVARMNDDCLGMTSSAPIEAVQGGARGRFTLREGEWAAFLLRWDDDSPELPEDYDMYGRLGRTQAFWRFVAHDWRYMGRWEEVVKRSMLALHLLIYVPTGAVCAAATTSLPEQIGGSRNWDYRYSWLRDAAFTLDVFNRLGHTAYTRPFIEWLAGLALGLGKGEDIHSLYGIGREDPHSMREDILKHLEGYRGSAPVRVGNGAFHQFQLDVFGEVLLSFDSFHRAGGIIDDSLWALAEAMVESALRHWQAPDNGIWEVRSEPKHFTFSKLMALGRRQPRPAPRPRPQPARGVRPLAPRPRRHPRRTAGEGLEREAAGLHPGLRHGQPRCRSPVHAHGRLPARRRPPHERHDRRRAAGASGRLLRLPLPALADGRRRGRARGRVHNVQPVARRRPRHRRPPRRGAVGVRARDREREPRGAVLGDDRAADGTVPRELPSGVHAHRPDSHRPQPGPRPQPAGDGQGRRRLTAVPLPDLPLIEPFACGHPDSVHARPNSNTSTATVLAWIPGRSPGAGGWVRRPGWGGGQESKPPGQMPGGAVAGQAATQRLKTSYLRWRACGPP